MNHPENHVLLRVDDFADTPFLVERPFGNGSVLVFNSTADRRWNNMPVTPAYVCFMQEVLPYLAARSDTARNLHINEPFTEVIPNRDYAKRIYLFRPDSSSQPVALKERDDKSFLLDLPVQPLPGIYEVRFGSRVSGEAADEDSGRTDWFCVNVDPDEGILLRVEPDELREAYGSEALSFRQLETAGADPAADFRGSTGEMWRALMWAVLLLLLAESFLARWFGTHHPARTAARTR